MKAPMKSRCGRPVASRAAQMNSAKPAFTLVELLVVIAIVAVLAATLLPALANGKYPSQVLNCASNYKQWSAMCNVYASDDSNGRYPSFLAPGAGGNPSDVAVSFVTNLMPYGMTVQMFFCPVRPVEVDYANIWFRAKYRKGDIVTIGDLNQYFIGTDTYEVAGVAYVGRSLNGGYGKLLHEFWVPRLSTFSVAGPPVPGGYLFPAPNPGNPGQTPCAPSVCPGWPSKPGDKMTGYQPIVSDMAETVPGYTAASNLRSGAHFYNGVLDSINVGFADGRVETHNTSQISWQYTSQATTFY